MLLLPLWDAECGLQPAATAATAATVSAGAGQGLVRGGTFASLWLCFLSSNGICQCKVATLLCHISAHHLV